MSVAFQSGIESVSQTRYEDNLLEREEYLTAKGRINVPLGETEKGELIVRDLSTIPHMLICGFTGTGKTAFVKTLTSVIISKKSSQDVKFVIYDTRRIDYAQFEHAPHLLFPITSDREMTIKLIKHLAQESQKRFEQFANSRCKDFARYNEIQTDEILKLPEIFLVLDDFASLQLDRNEAYELMTILRNGRIAGIHAIIVSSMASTKALQKELISVIPCRISFGLATKAESRTVLEQSGAEELFVPGEMIYKYQNDCYKCQSAHATDENIDNVMKCVQHKSISITSLGVEAALLFMGLSIGENGLGESESSFDECLEKAARFVIANPMKTSIGSIQRLLMIGFNRAARIMDQLEDIGVVSQSEGTKPRKVLMTMEEFETYGLGLIKNPDDTKTSRSLSKIIAKISEKKTDDEPVVILRDFEEFSVGETKMSISNNKIFCEKPMKVRLGEGTLSSRFDGSSVKGLIYKKPSVFSPGYMTFIFVEDLDINNKRPDLLYIDKNNISEINKIEFDITNDRTIRMFLEQLSEDIGVPITYLR